MHFDETPSFSTLRFSCLSFPFQVWCKIENLELENLGVNQSTSRFDQNASENNSEVFISEFSVLGIVQNGKLGVENLRKTLSKVFEFSEDSEFSTSPNIT